MFLVNQHPMQVYQPPCVIQFATLTKYVPQMDFFAKMHPLLSSLPQMEIFAKMHPLLCHFRISIFDKLFFKNR